MTVKDLSGQDVDVGFTAIGRTLRDWHPIYIKRLNEAESLQQEIDTWKFCIAAAALLALMWLAIWLAGFNGQRLSADIGHWGQLGDSIGGIMNPLWPSRRSTG